MKRILGTACMIVLGSTMAMADSWSGHVIDVMCKGKDAASHTKGCAIGCAKGGYGLLTSDGKFVKFDEAGNAKALAALKASTRDKDLRAKVTGKLANDVIAVESIEIEK
ncbi:MAG: hypothetical protein SFV54_26700 [Bryobacteraceae bacterium]|nr:hypothetical protein [Bryobacteraceae bacterium]